MPGPAISELASVGLKVAVENGKLAIKIGAKLVKKGEAVTEKAAGVLSKLGITPMKVGFLPIAAYDSSDKKVYAELNVDPEAVLAVLKEQFGRSLGFAVKIGYPSKETISYMLQRAGREEIALNKKVDVQTDTKEASA